MTKVQAILNLLLVVLSSKLVFADAAITGSSLFCYECNSNWGACGDPPDLVSIDSTKVECNGVCVTYCNPEDGYKIYRGCSSRIDAFKLQDHTTANAILYLNPESGILYNLCNSYLCNSGKPSQCGNNGGDDYQNVFALFSFSPSSQETPESTSTSMAAYSTSTFNETNLSTTTTTTTDYQPSSSVTVSDWMNNNTTETSWSWSSTTSHQSTTTIAETTTTEEIILTSCPDVPCNLRQGYLNTTTCECECYPNYYGKTCEKILNCYDNPICASFRLTPVDCASVLTVSFCPKSCSGPCVSFSYTSSSSSFSPRTTTSTTSADYMTSSSGWDSTQISRDSTFEMSTSRQWTARSSDTSSTSTNQTEMMTTDDNEQNPTTTTPMTLSSSSTTAEFSTIAISNNESTTIDFRTNFTSFSQSPTNDDRWNATTASWSNSSWSTSQPDNNSSITTDYGINSSISWIVTNNISTTDVTSNNSWTYSSSTSFSYANNTTDNWGEWTIGNNSSWTSEANENATATSTTTPWYNTTDVSNSTYSEWSTWTNETWPQESATSTSQTWHNGTSSPDWFNGTSINSSSSTSSQVLSTESSISNSSSFSSTSFVFTNSITDDSWSNSSTSNQNGSSIAFETTSISPWTTGPASDNFTSVYSNDTTTKNATPIIPDLNPPPSCRFGTFEINSTDSSIYCKCLTNFDGNACESLNMTSFGQLKDPYMCDVTPCSSLANIGMCPLKCLICATRQISSCKNSGALNSSCACDCLNRFAGEDCGIDLANCEDMKGCSTHLRGDCNNYLIATLCPITCKNPRCF